MTGKIAKDKILEKMRIEKYQIYKISFI